MADILQTTLPDLFSYMKLLHSALKSITLDSINNIAELVKIMAWNGTIKQ